MGITISNQIGKGRRAGTSGFSWSNATAEAYYNQLALVNGADIDSVSIYSITLDAMKTAINDHFVDLNTAGVLSRLTRYYPFIGATDATHAVEATNATSELIYVASPTQNSNGMSLNGTTQYANVNNDASVDMTLNDTHMMFLITNPLNGKIGMGCQINSSSCVRWLMNNNNAGSWVTYSTSGGSTGGAGLDSMDNTPVIGSRRSSSYSGLFVNGVEQTSIATTAGAIPARPVYIGALNLNNTGITYPSAGQVKSFSFGLGLDATQTTAFNTAIKNLQTALGR
tara:strand:- start:8734 stop:9582 length:849 start_codon:yes stop_codon:yes gene_type:complete